MRWKGFIAEGDTWESKENLENVQELVEEFEEEYGKDNREVRRQEKIEDNQDYWRGGFPGRYAARKLFGWSDIESMIGSIGKNWIRDGGNGRDYSS